MAFLAGSAIAVIGLFAAKVGDRLRTPLIKGKPCEDTHAWSYRSGASQQENAWLPVRPANDPCA